MSFGKLGAMGRGFGHLGALGRAGTSGPVSLSYEQIIGSNGRISAGVQATSAGTIRLETRRVSSIGGQAAATFRLGYGNYYVDTNGAEQLVGNGYTLEAAIEIPSAPNTNCVRVTFSGSNTGTVPDGADLFLSDSISASAFGLSTIPAGTLIYIHDSVLVTAGQNIPISNVYTPSAGEKSVQNNNGTSQVMTPGVPTGTEVNLQSPLIAVLGKFMAPEVSLALFGDSIENYVNDTNSSGINGTTGGMYVRPAWGVNGRNIPWSNISRTNAQAVVTSGSCVKRLAVLRYATHMLTDYGTNDVLAGTASATIQAALQKLWGLSKSFGVSRVEQSNIIPRTTSTDGFITVVNQTPQTNYGVGGIRDTLNTAITANVGSNGLDALLDLNSVLQDQTTTTAWIAPPAQTADGTHPSGAGITTGATYLATRYASYSPAAVIASAYDTATQAALAAMTTQTNARALLIDNVIRALKGYGLWTQLDAFYMFAAVDSASSLINWKNPGTFNTSIVGSPTFTADRGFTGNATNAALSSNFVPSTAGGVYTLNSSHVAGWVLNSVAAASNTKLFGNAAGGTGRTQLLVRNTGDIVSPMINDATFGTGTNTNSAGFYVMRRTASNARSVIKDAATPSSDSTASTALPAQPIWFLADGGTFSGLQIACGSIGQALGFTDSQNYRAVLLQYLRAVGAQ